MPTTSQTLAFAVTATILVVIPGPSVLFTIGPEGQADAATVSLGGVGPDAAASFTRVTEVA